MKTSNRAKNPTVFVASYDCQQDAFQLDAVESSKQERTDHQNDRDRGRPVKALKIELY